MNTQTNREERIKEKIKNLPSGAGIYLMKDVSARVIYVGKAKSIRSRVSSYFRPSAGLDAKGTALISSVRDIEYVSTADENEALILENNLIKLFRPKYNISLKDDKTYPHLKLDMNEEFPSLTMVRRSGKEGHGSSGRKVRYFGPYPDVSSLKSTLKVIQKIFPLIKCKKKFFSAVAKKKNPHLCLYYHLGHCLAPCAGGISRKEYAKIVRNVVLFLRGKRDLLKKNLAREMEMNSKHLRFEEARVDRDRIYAIESVARRIRVRRIEMEKLNLIKRENEVEELREILGLPALPSRIEGFDISSISGKEAVGSMVVFRNGMPSPSEYRKFRIKTVPSADDVGMMKEVVFRRYRRLLKENLPLPDMVVIDGGKGHLNGVMEVMTSLRIRNMPVIALAKSEELIHIPDRLSPLRLPRSSGSLRLVQRVRDEAHRFALAYHHVLRRGKIL